MAGLLLGVALERFARPQGLPDLLIGVEETEAEALAAGFLLDGAVAAREGRAGDSRLLLAELQIEAVVAGYCSRA